MEEMRVKVYLIILAKTFNVSILAQIIMNIF